MVSARVKHPAAQQNETNGGSQKVGEHQHGGLDPSTRLGDKGVQASQRTAGDAQCDAEDDESFDVVARDVIAVSYSKCVAAVGRGIADRRDQKGDQVRGWAPSQPCSIMNSSR